MSLKILFVENEPAIAELLVPSLERQGYQVSLARTQRQAISRCRSQQPDLLILDVISFGTNGHKTYHAVRSRLDGVPTVVLVEKPLAGPVTEAEQFMLPPFTSRKLLHRIKKLAGLVANREIVVGPFALDPDTRVLTKGAVTCHLRPKEAALLTLFFRNPGRVLSMCRVTSGRDISPRASAATTASTPPAICGA